VTTSQSLSSRLIAYTRPLGDITPLQFLRAVSGEGRVFWQRGQYSSAYAGAGAAVIVRGSGASRFDDVRAQIEDIFRTMVCDTTAPQDIQPRFFGGFAFELDGAQETLWASFGSAQMILPRLTLTRAGGYSWLTICDYGAGRDDARLNSLKDEFAAVSHRLGQVAQDVLPTHASDLRPLVCQQEWAQMIADGLAEIRAGSLRKIVLARPLDVVMNGDVDPLAALIALEKSYPTAYRFMIQPESGSVFFGASPELLARVEGGGLHTHALAGSAPRGETPEEDDRIAANLLSSVKDRHEQGLVVEWLRDVLTPLSRTLEIPAEPVVTKLKHIQHLFTPVQAQLRDRTHLLQVIERLHPTPALGGEPQRASQEAISRIEHFPRGWYGAPVGWVDSQGNGEFAVAIRSAVAHLNHARLYAGAGIVEGSDAEREWVETGVKFKPMLDALNIRMSDWEVDSQLPGPVDCLTLMEQVSP
jgi:menaquinone-specific isochorismate synthase